MNQTLPTIVGVAAEAEFQLLAAKDQLLWLAALAKAIQLCHVHSDGQGAAELASLAKYLDDTGFAGVDSAIENFRRISEGIPAPQKSTPRNRGASSIGGSARTLAERLVLAREAASLSQVELAKRVGIEQGTISQIERGISKRTSYLPEIARACGVSIEWLAFGQGVAA